MRETGTLKRFAKRRSCCRYVPEKGPDTMENILISACLLGVCCRYDGESKPIMQTVALMERYHLVPVCPEQLGGLPTPREPSERQGCAVVMKSGTDVTAQYRRGAEQTLHLARLYGCKAAVLKERSPSCGSGEVYDGTFSGALVPGYGATARLLRTEGVRVVDEEQLAAVLASSAARHPDALPALFAETSAACPVLETERLVLRAIGPEDAEDVFAYCSDPDVGADAGWPVHRTLDDSRAFIEAVACEPHVFGVFEKLFAADGADGSDGAVSEPRMGPCIGSVGLIPDPQRRNVDALMLGYSLAKPAWGRGYMTEASREVIRYGFEELALGLISCTHYLFNDRSRRVIEKCGFEREGIIHAAEPAPDGTMQDLETYYLTRVSWEEASRESAPLCANPKLWQSTQEVRAE